MTLRAWLAAGLVAAAVTACRDAPASAPSVSTGGQRDASDDELDASRASADSGGRGQEPEPDASGADGSTGAGTDASDSAPAAPISDGVHLSIERGAYQTASDAFYFETTRPGIQGEFAGGTLRVALSDALGTTSCSDGATVEWTVAGGRLIASRELGSCSITIEAFGERSGDRIAATFHALVERASGELVDALELHGRIQVGHP